MLMMSTAIFQQARCGLPRIFLFSSALLIFARLASGGIDVKFLKTVELPGVNLSLKVMPDSKEAPPAPPTVYTYRSGNNGEETPVEKFLPSDLWRNSQIVCRWADKSGNILTLAAVTRPLVTDSAHRHVLREEYSQKLVEAGEPPPWTEQALVQWVSDFIESEASPTTPPPTAPPRLADLIEFTAGNQSTNFLAYAFRLNPNAPGQAGATTNWFCAILQTSRGTDRENAHAAMAADFLRSLAIAGKSRISGQGLPSQAMDKTAASMTNRSSEFMASRQQVADNIRNMKNWWSVETKHYIILSNMKSRRSTLFKNILTNIETIRACFEQLIPSRTEISSVSVIRIFATSAEYAQYVGEGKEWSVGFWMPNKKELVIRPAEWGDSVAKGQQIMGTVYHEAFHQYIFYALDRVHASRWFDEGHAEFFEAGAIGANRLDIGENPDNNRIIDDLIESKTLDFKELLHMSSDRFYTGDNEIRSVHYATAWALVYYLRKATPLGKLSPYDGISDAYCDALVRLRDADKATDKAFENVDIARLQADFIAFWKSPSKRSQADQNKIFKSLNPPAASLKEKPL